LSIVREFPATKIGVHPIIVSLPPKPSRQQISDAVEKLVDLFRQMTEAPRKTVAGLWAELFIIDQAHDPAKLLASRHALPEERFISRQVMTVSM
jgi:hypothetical protein